VSEPTKSSDLARLELARLLDHTLRRADASARDVEALCAEARAHGCFGVCVNSSRVAQAAALLEDSPLKVTCAIGLPLGAADTDVKRFEIETALDLGAHVLEVAASVGVLKDASHAALLRELRDLVEAAEERPLSVWFDPDLLRPEEMESLGHLALEAGAKGLTIAGHTGAAAAAALKQLAPIAREKLGLKVDADALTRSDLVTLLGAGANRFGLTESISVLESL
jgi:deoxyribose-phosphate aldolase